MGVGFGLGGGKNMKNRAGGVENFSKCFCWFSYSYCTESFYYLLDGHFLSFIPRRGVRDTFKRVECTGKQSGVVFCSPAG